MVGDTIIRKFKKNSYYKIYCKCGCKGIYIVKVTKVNILENKIESIIVKAIPKNKNECNSLRFDEMAECRIDFVPENIEKYEKCSKDRVFLEVI